MNKTQRAKRAKLIWSRALPQTRKTVFLLIIFIVQSSFLNYPHSTYSPLASTAHADPTAYNLAYLC